MYSTLTLTNNEHSGDLTGTHQKLDRTARFLITKYMGARAKHFPEIDEILHFEGNQGPDGIKRKSPGVDEPEHFIEPDNDDGVLIGYVKDHLWNLSHALADGNRVRASFEAAWMAHAITDGLTPAHHFPFRKKVDELMSDMDYKKLFGIKIKGIMRGHTLLEAARNNWAYSGAGGIMTKHIAFEFGVAYTITPIPYKRLAPRNLKRSDFQNVDCVDEFYRSLEVVANMDMYTEFLRTGWNTQLIVETRDTLIPEIVRAICMGWAAAIEESERIVAERERNEKAAIAKAMDESETESKTKHSKATVRKTEKELDARIQAEGERTLKSEGTMRAKPKSKKPKAKAKVARKKRK